MSLTNQKGKDVLLQRVAELQSIADSVRRSVLEAVHHAGAGHIGGPFSAAEMLAALYFEVLNIDPEQPGWAERDRFILSKGHAAIGLYSVLALRGFFPTDELMTFDAIDSRLQGHPDMTKLPGIDMSTGSLGQGLSPGVGMALGARFLGQTFRTYVMVGDGEAQEGQIWEAAFVASRYGLDNLVAIIDHNQLQQFGWSTDQGYAAQERRPPLDQPARQWAAFGWNVLECDGHDITAFVQACHAAKAHPGQPTAIVAHTTKGRGVSFMEGDFTWHSKPMSAAQYTQALAELAPKG